MIIKHVFSITNDDRTGLCIDALVRWPDNDWADFRVEVRAPTAFENPSITAGLKPSDADRVVVVQGAGGVGVWDRQFRLIRHPDMTRERCAMLAGALDRLV